MNECGEPSHDISRKAVRGAVGVKVSDDLPAIVDPSRPGLINLIWGIEEAEPSRGIPQKAVPVLPDVDPVKDLEASYDLAGTVDPEGFVVNNRVSRVDDRGECPVGVPAKATNQSKGSCTGSIPRSGQHR